MTNGRTFPLRVINYYNKTVSYTHTHTHKHTHTHTHTHTHKCVTNEESLNALKVQLALQTLPNEKVTIRQLSRSELFSCQNCHLYDQPARPEMRPIKMFLNISSLTLN